MSMKKMVSIIIPVYRSKEYLESCIKSILNQTYNNIEIILVDDGADDGSGKICDLYSQKYKNIICVHQNNRGVSCARNEGIKRASGEYILFVDSDDYIKPSYLENATLMFENYDIDMYLCGYQETQKKGAIAGKTCYPTIKDGKWNCVNISNIIINLFCSGTLHAIGTKLYKKSIIDQYQLRFINEWKYFEDIYFCLSYLLCCNEIYVHNKIMYFYQIDVNESLLKQYNHYNYVSIYRTYLLLDKFLVKNASNSNERKKLYEKYFNQINQFINLKFSVEKKYTNEIKKLYQLLARDIYYKNALIFGNKIENIEYFFVSRGLFLLGYYVRNYLSSELLMTKVTMYRI